MADITERIRGLLREVSNALETGAYDQLGSLATRLGMLETTVRDAGAGSRDLSLLKSDAQRTAAMLEGAREGLAETLTAISIANQRHSRLEIYSQDGTRTDVAPDSRRGRTA